MTPSVIAYILLLILLFTSCSSDHAGDGTEIESYFGTRLTAAAVDSALEAAMKKYNIPGLSFALINGGQTVHRKTLG